jgi:hypothetical protein
MALMVESGFRTHGPRSAARHTQRIKRNETAAFGYPRER